MQAGKVRDEKGHNKYKFRKVRMEKDISKDSNIPIKTKEIE